MRTSIADIDTPMPRDLDFRQQFRDISKKYSPEPRGFYSFPTSVVVSVTPGLPSLPPPIYVHRLRPFPLNLRLSV